MDTIRRFPGFLRAKPFLFLYMLVLVTALLLFFRFFPVSDIVMGLFSLSETSALSGLVAFAQWVSAPDMRLYTFLFIFAGALPLAMALALLFAGALGLFAGGMEFTAGFPARPGMGFLSGYRRCFMQLVALFYAAITGLLLMLLVWTIAVTPLAVIDELAGRGALSPVMRNFSIAVTALIVYVGFLFLRIFPLSCVPGLYSGAARPVRSAFSFAGRHFFGVARYFLLADVVMVCFAALYGLSRQNLILFFVNCAVAAATMLFLFFALFDSFAAKGYGFDGLDEAIGPDERGGAGRRGRPDQRNRVGQRGGAGQRGKPGQRGEFGAGANPYADEDAYEAEDFDEYADMDEDMDEYMHGDEAMDEYAGEVVDRYMGADMRRRARGGEELGGW
ncbi:MAG: hypothetical protein LBU58_04975, partial [Clostridiales bacterium]|nr:hypothetical protein [Clostridiales bacterium]